MLKQQKNLDVFILKESEENKVVPGGVSEWSERQKDGHSVCLKFPEEHNWGSFR